MAKGQKFILSFLGKDQGASAAASSIGTALGGLSNAVKKVTQASSSMGGKLSASVVASQPALAKLRTDLDRTAATMRSNTGAFAGGFFGKEGSLKNIQSQLNQAKAGVQKFSAQLDVLKAKQTAIQSKKSASMFEEGFARAEKDVKKLSAELKKLAAERKKLAKNASTPVGDLNKIDAAIKNTNKELDKAVDRGAKFADKLQASLSGAQSLQQKIATVSTKLSTSTANAARLSIALAGAKLSDKLKTTFTGIGKSLKSMPAGLNTVAKGFLALNDPIRYVSQAVGNFGRQLMFVTTIPIAAFLGFASKSAIGIENSFVNLERAADRIPTDQMEVLKDKIRELAKNTRSSHEELIGTSTALAAAGAETAAGIFNMTMNIEQFAIGTDQSLEEATSRVVKFSNAFGWSLDGNVDDIKRFLNVVNLVGKRTAATADEVLTAAMDFAPFAAMLGLSAANTVAFSAALPSLGLSADEAGTALKNMSVYAIENADKIASAMAPVNAAYTDTKSVLDMLNQDAAQVFLDIAQAAQRTAEEGGDAAGAIREIMDIFEQRGGRAVAVLTNNTELLTQAMADAKNEWETATSLVADYERQMKSTQSQIALFKNNINDAGITVGEVLLPVLNDIIQVAVPAIRYLADAFKKLGRDGQIKIVALVGAFLLLGPVMMVLGQFVHFISMLNMGIGTALKAVASLSGGIMNLGGTIIGIGKFFLGWPGLVVLAVVGVLKIISTMGVNISGFFKNIAASAKTWGENLAANLGSGLIAGAVRFVTKAINYIANMIAGFFESHSPPDQGPLATIDRWGIGLMETFMKGFKQADFGLLSEVGGIIERELTRGVEDIDMPGALNAVKNAREIIAQMMTKFNATGILDENMLDSATKGLGELSDNVKDLIQKWVKYQGLQQQIQDLEGRRKSVLKGYEREIELIGASNMTAEEKVAAIRKGMRGRDDSLRGIEKEKQVLEEEVDLAAQQYEYQQSMISALQDQGDLFARIADALERLARGGGAGVEASGFGWPEQPKGPVFDPDAAFPEFQEVIDRFTEGKAKFQGFLDGFNGIEPLTPEDFGTPEAYEAYMALYNVGKQAGEVKKKFTDFADGAKKAWKSVTNLFKGGDGGGIEMPKFDIKKVPILGDIINGFMAGFDTTGFQAAFGLIKKTWEDLMALLKGKDGDNVKNFWLGVGRVVGWLVGFLAGAVVTIVGWIAYIIAWIWLLPVKLGMVREKFRIFFTKTLPGFFAELVKKGKEKWAELSVTIPQKLEEMKTKISAKWEEIKNAIGTKWESIKTTVSTKIAELSTSISNKWGALKNIASTKWEEIKDAIKTKLFSMLDFWGFGPEIRARLADVWEDVKLISVTLWERLVESVTTKVDELWTSITETVGGIVESLSGHWETAKNKASELWALLVTAVLTKVEEIKTRLSTKWNEITATVSTVWELIKSKIGAAIERAWGILVYWLTVIKADLTLVWNKIASKVTEVWDGIVTSVTGKVQEVYDTVTGKIEELKMALGNLWETFKNIGASIGKGLIDGIKGAAQGVVSAAVGVAENAVNYVKENLDIESPSGVFEDIGKNTGLGFIKGINELSEDAQFAMRAMTTAPVTVTPMSFAQMELTQAYPERGAGNEQIVLNFNRDSVRSNKDIEEIANTVERILDKKMRGQLSFGGSR